MPTIKTEQSIHAEQGVDDEQIGIIGYGEVGRSMARSFAATGIGVVAFDLRWPPGSDDDGVVKAASVGEVAAACRVIWVCTPAAAIEVVAQQLAGHIGPDQFVVDLASAHADSKIRAMRSLGEASDAYLDIALSAPPLDDGIAARMYVSGPRAHELVAWGDARGMDLRFLGNRVGQATQLKILRAPLTKGLEAILLEALTTSMRYGVDPETLVRTVESAFDDRPFFRFCEYLIATGVVHDDRRAIEIGEAATMAEHAGVTADMARAAERVLLRSASLHNSEDEETFLGSLRAYARHVQDVTPPADSDLAVGPLA